MRAVLLLFLIFIGNNAYAHIVIYKTSKIYPIYYTEKYHYPGYYKHHAYGHGWVHRHWKGPYRHHAYRSGHYRGGHQYHSGHYYH